MISFHCLEIPLKNKSETFSGGEKLRLGLVRATLGRDVIIVDGDMNSLDHKVRDYVLREMQLLAEREGKIFIVKEERPLSEEIITIRDGVVRMEKATVAVQTASSEHEGERQQYCEQHLRPLGEMFVTAPDEVKLGATGVSPSLFRYYYSSYLHLMFLAALTALYVLRSEYNLYVVNEFQNDSFLTGLWKLVPQLIAAAVARSFLFAMANLFEARRLVNRVVRNICF